MTFSQTRATEGRTPPVAPAEAEGFRPGGDDGLPPGGADPKADKPNANPSPNPWRDAAVLLALQARRRLGLVIAAAVLCGLLAGLAKVALPTTYKASAQILIDPQEFRTLADDSQPAALDANAAINYVESQMGVIGSERVLLRVIRTLGLAGAPPQPDADKEPDATDESPEARRARELAENKALLGLQKSIAISRAERSFLVSITASDKSPERAAQLANAVVQAYGDVNAADRMAAARRLAADLSSRVEDLRRQLGEAETKLLNFKVEHNLVGINDRAIAERRVSETTDALTAAENREAQARARLKQLETAPADLSAVAAFGPDPESRQLQVLVEGRAAARGELEQLQSTLGDLHPAVVAGKARLRDFDRRISQAVEGLRRSARSQLAEAQGQAAALNKRLTDLAAESIRARAFEAPARELEADIESKRKALVALQTRWREAEDMSRREAPNFRIISPARAPNAQGKTFGALLWTIAGGVIGLALALGGLAVAALFEAPQESPERTRSEGEPAASAPAARRKVEALADLPPIDPAPGAEENPAADPAAAFLSEASRRPRSAYSRMVQAVYDRLLAEAEPNRAEDDDRPLVVLVAATWPEAGASTFAANLARAAASNGERVLLIDAHKAHPVQDRVAEKDAPATVIEAGGRKRPLLRLAPYWQSLSLIPSWPDEDRICAAIAKKGPFEKVDGLNGHFDFVVMDGPDASDEEGLRDLAGAADQILLVVSDEPGDEADAPDLLRRIGAPDRAFCALLRAAPRVLRRAADAA